jgi:hypothetical protein
LAKEPSSSSGVHLKHGERLMTSTQEKLEMLLDGILEPSEIADDPVLVSLAERLYGIKVAVANPKKSRDMVASPLSSDIIEISPPTNMLIEVVEPIVSPLPALGTLPDLPPAPDISSHSKMSLMSKLILVELTIIIMNIFGLFSFVLGGLCKSDTLCTSDGYTRINWLSIHKVDSGYGWSQSMVDMSIGIPDIIALSIGVIGFWYFSRK